ncbi:MAG: septal ring lytic transglycosylase RlpA family protein [Lysobacter sp.]|nr:septal ring lytic transglycosylase RlpA family protein [Lysobacter sp.]
MSILAGCGSAPKKDTPPVAHAPRSEPASPADAEPKRSPYAPAQEDPSKRGDYVAGGLYAPHVKDSVPDYVPDVAAIPEPEVKDEPRSRFGNRSYSVLGKTYRVLDSGEGYLEEGQASFYGKKFHGRLTSNQEVYDMNAFSAAHRSLPLPSYVRVTNLDNGKSVVVRVNDRGPFHSGRIIDLSYAAAVKLDFIRKGTTRVEVRALLPDDPENRRTLSRRERTRRGRAAQNASPPAVAAVAPAAPTTPANPALRADEFDRWMRERGARVATGRPGPAAGAPTETPAASVSIPAASTSVASTQAAVAEGGVSLQVAAFSAQDNAERAQQRLRDAGLPAVRIDAGEADGKPVWRLRIGPVAADRVAELSARCADLGFETVRVVRE